MKSILIFILFIIVLNSIDSANLKIKNMLTNSESLKQGCTGNTESWRDTATTTVCRPTSCNASQCDCTGWRSPNAGETGCQRRDNVSKRESESLMQGCTGNTESWRDTATTTVCRPTSCNASQCDCTGWRSPNAGETGCQRRDNVSKRESESIKQDNFTD